jgi:hypothetical protein
MDVSAFIAGPPIFEETIEVLVAADPIPHQQSDLETMQPRGPPDDTWSFADQVEYLAPPLASDEVMAAVDLQGLQLDPLPDPDFFQYNQPQDQIEWRSSRVTLNNTAEGGVDGVEVDDPNLGGIAVDPFDFVSGWGPGNTAVYYGTDQRIDTMAYRFETFDDFLGIYFGWQSTGDPKSIPISQPQMFARFYVWTGSIPNTGEVTLFLIQNNVGFNVLRAGFNSSSNFFLADTVDTVTSAVEPLKEKWIRIEVYCNPALNYAEMRYYMDPNAGVAFPTDVLIQGDVGSLDPRTFFFGWPVRSVDGDEPLTFFLDNIGVDNFDWMGPLGTAPATDVPPSTPAVIHPYDVVQPWPTRLFEEWEHVQPQDEFLFPPLPPAGITELIAAQPVFEVNPHPNPDFFQYNQPQPQNEQESPPVVPPIDIAELVAADMFSSGDYPARPVEPTDTFQTYDQNPDPAPIIPPDLTGLIRKVPRWAKHGRYFLPGGRFP